MELWDAYDSQFHKLEGITLVRGQPLPDGVFHLTCDVLVRHTDGEYLITRRVPQKPYGGMWEATSGGSALRGESAAECARRELREETGIDLPDLQFLGQVVSPETRTIYMEYLGVTACQKDSVRLQEGETDDYRWVSAKELAALPEDVLVTSRIQCFVGELRP